MVTQTEEADNGNYYPLLTPKNQGGTQTTTATYNRFVKVNPNISEWTFIPNNSDNQHDTPSFILSRSNAGANFKVWGSAGNLYLSTDYWGTTKKNTFSEHFIRLSPEEATITFQGHLLPNSSGWSLGSALAHWDSGYFTGGLMVGNSLNYGSATLPIYWNNGIPTAITSYEGTAARAISDEDGNNIKASYAASMSFSDGSLMLKNKNGLALSSIALGTLTVADITTGTETTSKLITAKVIKDSLDNAINALDVASTSFTDGEILSSISETNGKISVSKRSLTLGKSIFAHDIQIELRSDNTIFSSVTIPAMTAASANAAGAMGLVPAPALGDQNKFLRADGTWVLPDNTDISVQQNPITSSDETEYQVLLSYSNATTSETNTAKKFSGLHYNAKTGTLTVSNITGHAASANSAAMDGQGNVIRDTYALKANAVSNIEWDTTNKILTKTINSVSSNLLQFVAGNNITLTAANDSITITSANDNTTYGLSGSLTGETFVATLTAGGTGTQAVVPKMVYATNTNAGNAGLVPAPPAGGQDKILSGSGWVTPYSYTLPVATNISLGGIKIGYTESNKNYAVKLDNEQAYVTVPWTDRAVEGPLYHYEPQEDNAYLLEANASGGTAGWSLDFVKGVKVRRDSRGHITSIAVVSGKLPEQPTFTDSRDAGYGVIAANNSTSTDAPVANANTITAATFTETVKFETSNKWIKVGVADSSTVGQDKVYFGHALSANVSVGSYGPSADTTPPNGGAFNVPYVSVDKAGHITDISTKTVTLPTITDTKVTQNQSLADTIDSNFRVILSNSATGNEETNVVNKSNNLTYNPKNNKLSTGSIDLGSQLNVAGNVSFSTNTAINNLSVSGNAAFTSIPTAPTATAGANNTQLATTAFVTSAVQSITGPMRFIGTLGTGGTITALPAATDSNKGYTYKVITGGRYSQTQWEQDAIAGDVVISNGSQWILIPSGDEPSGTVTNIATGAGLTGGPITSTGTISHADTSTQANISASSRTYISGVTLDNFGHVTGLTTGTETVTDTHYTTHLYAGTGAAANANTTNGNTKLTIVDNSTVRNSITIQGNGSTTIASNDNGVVSIYSPTLTMTVTAENLSFAFA